MTMQENMLPVVSTLQKSQSYCESEKFIILESPDHV